MRAMELPRTPVKDVSPGAQENKTPDICSALFRRAEAQQQSRRKTFHFRHQHLEFMTLAPTRSFASPARTHETKRFPTQGSAGRPTLSPFAPTISEKITDFHFSEWF